MSVVEELSHGLKCADEARLLHIAWDVLTLTVQAADALTWKPEADPVAAMGAGIAASAGRDLLPLPQDGVRPALPDGSGIDFTRQLALLLDELHSRLDNAGRTANHPDQVYALHACADRAAEAAACLRSIRAER